MLKKIISLQFLHMAKFSAGIQRIAIAQNMYGIDDKTISSMRPVKLSVGVCADFLYGLGLNGYLKPWNSSSILYCSD